MILREGKAGKFLSGQIIYFQHELDHKIYFQVYQGQTIYFHPQQNFEKAKKKKNHSHKKNPKRGGVSECWFRRVPGPEQDFPWDQGIKTSIFQSWPILRDLDANDCVLLPNKPDFINAVCKDSKNCKTIYTIFVSKLYHKPKSEEKWELQFHLCENFDWRAVNKRPYKCTKDTKLLWLQYRSLHRSLGINEYLYKCKIKNTPLCNLCKSETESLIHLFFECTEIHDIWPQIENWIRVSTGLLKLYFHCRRHYIWL